VKYKIFLTVLASAVSFIVVVFADIFLTVVKAHNALQLNTSWFWFCVTCYFTTGCMLIMLIKYVICFKEH